MASIFEQATRTALADLIEKHARETKFGLLLTEEGKQDVIDDLYEFLLTSRKLKAAGDRMMAGQFIAGGDRPANPSRKRRLGFLKSS